MEHVSVGVWLGGDLLEAVRVPRHSTPGRGGEIVERKKEVRGDVSKTVSLYPSQEERKTIKPP